MRLLILIFPSRTGFSQERLEPAPQIHCQQRDPPSGESGSWPPLWPTLKGFYGELPPRLNLPSTWPLSETWLWVNGVREAMARVKISQPSPVPNPTFLSSPTMRDPHSRLSPSILLNPSTGRTLLQTA